MTLHLSRYDRECLEGERGPATKLAMSVVAQMAEVQEATELISITQAHIDATVYVGDAGLEFAEHLAALGAKVSVPSTLNVSGVDEHGWQAWAVPEEWAEKARRQMNAYQSMGTIPIWTCTPYQTRHKPEFGEQIAWGESNAIVFANSVIGARTERYPDMFDVCCAITGRVPAVGLHLSPNRRGNILMRLKGVPNELQLDDTFYTMLGYLMGNIAGNRIPVIDGLTVEPTEDQLKALGATAASSGAVALFHLVGVTPEAPTVRAAFQGEAPAEVVSVTTRDLKRIYRELTTSEGQQIDLVVLGSPHLSVEEFKQLIPLIQNQRVHPSVQFLVTTSRAVAHLVEQAGVLDVLQAFGARVTVDTCILTTPMLPGSIETIMTNAGKFAYYTPGLLNRQVVFGSLEDCVRSAIAGHVLRDDNVWNT